LGLENHKSWLISTNTITPDIGYGSQAVIKHLKVMDHFWDERISVKKKGGCELGEFSCPKDHGREETKADEAPVEIATGAFCHWSNDMGLRRNKGQ
jgi:hypothetical protein